MFKQTEARVIGGCVLLVAVVVVLVLALSSSSTPSTNVSAQVLPTTPACASGSCAPGAGLGVNVVAQIGAASITQAELDHWLVIANDASQTSTGAAATPLPLPPRYTACIAAQKKLTPTKSEASLKAVCVQGYQALLNQVLPYLLESVWLQGAAADRGIIVTPTQTQTAFISDRKAATPSLTTTAALNAFMSRSGETVADLKWRTYIGLLSSEIGMKVQESVAAVTSAQIRAYYKQNLKQFNVPETRDLHLVETSTLTVANLAKGLLAGGSGYAEVAPLDSIDPTTKKTGGAMSAVSLSSLNPQLRAAVAAARTGVLSGPVKTASGYYVFTVNSVTPSSVASLAKVSAAIKSTLTQQRVTKAETALQAGLTAKWMALTNCRSSFLTSEKGAAAVPGTLTVQSVCAKTPLTTAIPADTRHIVPPPALAQTLVFTPTKSTQPTAPTATSTTPTSTTSAVSTPTSGPLSTEPTITVPKGPAPKALVKSDIITGTGAVVSAGDTITVNYVGVLYATGKVFDASWLRKQTFTTAIGTGAVIKGWDEGIVGMRVGGRRELIIPPALAYGATARSSIPANSTLIFIVDLLAVTPGTGTAASG